LQKRTRNIVVIVLFLGLLLTSPILVGVNVHGAGPTTLRVDPPDLNVEVCSEFFADVYVDTDWWVSRFGIILTYDTSIIDAIDVWIYAPFTIVSKIVDDASGFMLIEGEGGPVPPGTSGLARFGFHCTGVGTSALTIAQYYLLDPGMNLIPVDNVVNGHVTQWLYKPSYPDYAPSGVPDFDQKQWGLQMWRNPFPPVGTWSHCGPVAVANSMWWLDSEYEPSLEPPPTPNDGFPLVQTYIPGKDDHDPLNVPYLVEDLALLMDTNGQRFGHMHCGTEVHEMTMALNEYIYRQGLDWKFYVHLQKAPDFFWIAEEIKKCQDVVLLLGFWQGYPGPGPWWRVGGHYVTCAGVNPANMMLAISDPYIDNAEMGGAGRVIPPAPHPHTGPPERVHNDAAYVSHDSYTVGQSPSPGGPFGFYDYPAEYVIDNFDSCQNTPDEFIQLDGEYIPGLPIYTEIEYAVVTSCKTGIVAAGSEDTNIYVWDFFGSLQWQFALANPVVSVAMDNNGRYIAAGTRSIGMPVTGGLWLFDNSLGGAPGNVLWAYVLPVSTSYDGSWAGTESKSVDVKYNNYSGYVVVAAATDQGLYLYDQSGALVWHYYDGSPETIVRISQDGNYIVCADYNTGLVHYFSHLRDRVPGWGPNDGTPIWTFGGAREEMCGFWVAISGDGDYVAASVYPFPMAVFPAKVVLLDRTGSIVWFYLLPKGGFVRVDMPCSGTSVVSVNDDPSDGLGCDLNYWSDGGNGWDGGDSNPVWTYWPGKEFGLGQTPTDDFYSVAISENGAYIATGGVPHNTYLLKNDGTLQQTIGLMPGAIQSIDLTFTGKYGASVDNAGWIWFFSKDTGFSWASAPSGAPFHCVAVSKIYPCMFPYPNHDVDVHKVTPFKTVVGEGFKTRFTVTLSNEGDFIETGYMKLWVQNATYLPSLFLANSSTMALLPGFMPNVTLEWTPQVGIVRKGNYTVFAVVGIVNDEIDVYDNTCVDGWVFVTIPGDVNGDRFVNVKDAVLLNGAFGAQHITDPLDPRYCQYWRGNEGPFSPNVDINCDGYINIKDAVIQGTHFGESW